MVYSVEIGKNIVEMRKKQKMSQEELSFRSDVCISYLREIEHGKANPSIDTLESIAEALGMELPVLFLYAWDEAEIMQMLRKSRDFAAAY